MAPKEKSGRPVRSARKSGSRTGRDGYAPHVGEHSPEDKTCRSHGHGSTRAGKAKNDLHEPAQGRTFAGREQVGMHDPAAGRSVSGQEWDGHTSSSNRSVPLSASDGSGKNIRDTSFPDSTAAGDRAGKGAPGVLYMIPCPIGEGGDPYDVLPLYNREVIRSLDYFVVENLRSARRFLSRAGIGKPIDSLEFAELNEHTTPAETEQLIRPLLAGRNAGMISEAGLPGVADPGADIAALCHRHGIRVVPLVGPSSLMLALMASGLNGQSFAFNGYLPVKPPERGKAIRFFEHRAHTERQSQLFIEAPYRNLKLFAEFLSVCQPDTKLTVAADLLCPGEFIRTAPVRQWRTSLVPDIDKRPAIFILG